MSLTMSKAEREAFLADVHIGIISIAQPGHGPLTVPIWYGYHPGADLWFVTDRTSRKGQLLAEGTRVSLCAQTEQPPYKYVSVEGPVTAIVPAEVGRDIRPLAHRYLGRTLGDQYIDSIGGAGAASGSVLVRMRPEVWFSVDYAKEGRL
jgi:hypothetical protein